MKSEWKTCKAEDFIEFNPQLTIRKGEIATKVSMDKLQPFTKAILEVEQVAFSGGSKFCNSDTIMARITPCLENGKTAFVNNLQDGEVAFGSTEFIVMRARPGISDPQFVYYLAISPFFRGVAIKSMVGSSGRQRVQQSVLNELELTIPPLDEQRRIGAFLSRLDDKIELNQKINENLERQLHALYMKIFAESAMDAALGDVVVTTSGGTPSRKHSEYYDYGNIGWVKSKELLGGYLHDTEEHINELAVAKSSAKLLPTRSVLIAMYGATVGAYGIISKPMACNQAICALLCNEKYPYTYLFQVACESQKKLINLAVGSAQQNISQILIKQLPVHSDENIIRRFHLLACPIHEKIEILQAENRQLSEIRDTLLPKLMAGEIDTLQPS